MQLGVPAVTDERSGLLTFLAQQRRIVKAAAYGLTPQQLRTAPSASALSVGGLLKHVAAVERSWLATVLGQPSTRPEDESDFVLTDEDTLDSLVADYDAAAADTERIVAGADLGQPVSIPNVDAGWTVRWVLLHLIEETARHAGHADIVRESIDGATTFELLATAEEWPPMSWITPWQPKEPR